MALFWIVHEIDGERRVFIQEGSALIFARLDAAIAGFDDGVFVEAHMLDAKTAKKVPKKMIGRVVVAPRGQRAAGSHVVTRRPSDRGARLAGKAAGAFNVPAPRPERRASRRLLAWKILVARHRARSVRIPPAPSLACASRPLRRVLEGRRLWVPHRQLTRSGRGRHDRIAVRRRRRVAHRRRHGIAQRVLRGRDGGRRLSGVRHWVILRVIKPDLPAFVPAEPTSESSAITVLRRRLKPGFRVLWTNAAKCPRHPRQNFSCRPPD